MATNITVITGSGTTTYTVNVDRRGPAGPNEVTTATTTNITGLLKGNGSTVLAATAGTDYAAAIHTHTTADITDATSDGQTNPGKLLKTDANGALQINTLSLGSSDIDATDPGELIIYNATDVESVYGSIKSSNLTTARDFELPNTSGTIMVGSNNLSDLSSASTARTNLGAGATGAAIFQAATVAAAQTALGWLKCTMSGNETRTNADGQTYADVSAMNSVTLAANTRYRVWGFLPVEIGGCGLKAQLVLPDMWQNDGSVNLAMMTHGSATSLTVIGFGSNVVQIGSTGTANSGAVWQFFGMIQTGSGSGTAKLQIASVDIDAGTTTLYSGAIITFELIP